MRQRLLNIALSPLFLSLVITGLILLVIPLGINKYLVNQVDSSVYFDQTQFFFEDLNHDGISERIQTFINKSGNAGLAIAIEDKLYGQWNFKGVYHPESVRFITGDYDHNRLDEIYIFTLTGDSVILNALDFGPNPHIFLNNRFIAKIGANLKDPDFVVYPGAIVDMNSDDFGDLVFAITAGFSKQPRNVFIYDILKDSLQISPESGAFIDGIILDDMNQDGFQEILLSTFAAGNFNEESFPFSDTSSWLMLLDHDLNFVFLPVEFPGVVASVHNTPINSDNGPEFILGSYHQNSSKSVIKKLFLADINGNIIKEKTSPFEDNAASMEIPFKVKTLKGHKNYTVIEDVGFFEINNRLETSKVSNLKIGRNRINIIDIDQDGEDEIIGPTSDQSKLLIIRNDFSSYTLTDFPAQSLLPIFSVKLNGKNPSQLSIQDNQVWKLYDYGINPVYRLRILIWIGIYLFALGFILLIRKLYSFQLKKKYETEKKISTLQLSSVKAQMEPHFIMNTINTIGSSIYRQKPDEAYQLLVNFSSMVRSLLLSSDTLTRTLKEEIDFVINYLDLEKSRFPKVFDYSIKIDEAISGDIIIPKMIIQLHIENALKHGILPKEENGLLIVDISKEPDYLVISISDNGIGRNRPKSISTSTGKGMRILNQFFETYNKYNRKHLSQEITDLFDTENNPAGTQVRIFIPLEFNKEIY